MRNDILGANGPAGSTFVTPRKSERVGVLLVQLGTPDAPTPEALRPYLRKFLGDPRVIETANSWKWQLILNLMILPTRPAVSAAKYARIWDVRTGSPLLHWTQRQTELLQQCLPDIPVRFGMQIGNPPISQALGDMIRQGVDRLIVLPMYPQYSATTTASAMDALFSAFKNERRVPSLRVVPPYYGHPAYIEALRQVITRDLEQLSWRPDYFLLSFHGLPIKYAQKGDPYATHVKRTTRLLTSELGWRRDRWSQTFQSQFGRDPWLKPSTDDVLKSLARRGMKKVFVAMPGFTADCLETVDEIGNESRHLFFAAGGEMLHACRCLNDHPAWIEAMHTLICEEGRGWLSESDSALPVSAAAL